MKKILLLALFAAGLMACGSNSGSSEEKKPSETTTEQKTETTENPSYDPNRGEGKFTKVEIGASLDATKATAGEKVYSVKCSACHKLTDEKLVGPGWKDVTKRHSAEWIMNFSTNTDAMLNKDPKAQAMLEICLVRMPNQNLTDDEARDVYEYMRKNDGIK